MSDDTLLGYMQTRARVDKESGLITFVGSTSQVDRADDVVRQDFRLKNYRANPVILWMHQSGIPPIGRSAKTRIENANSPEARLLLDVAFDEGEHNPLATTVAAQVRSGMLGTGSVGFRPGKRTLRSQLPEDHAAYQKLAKGTPEWLAGIYFEQNELLEFSITTIPMNPGAVALRAWARQAVDGDQAVQRALNETADKLTVEQIMRAVRADEQIRRQVEMALLSLPAEVIPDPVPADNTPPEPVDPFGEWRAHMSSDADPFGTWRKHFTPEGQIAPGAADVR